MRPRARSGHWTVELGVELMSRYITQLVVVKVTRGLGLHHWFLVVCDRKWEMSRPGNGESKGELMR